jgi:Tfp pilus assembly protein PilF
MGDAQNWFDRGVTLFSKRDLTGAIAAFDKAILFNQSPIEAWYNRGLIFAQMGNNVKALQSFDQTLSQDPGNGNAIKARTMILTRMKNQKTTTIFQ